jgi:hypothetical protein
VLNLLTSRTKVHTFLQLVTHQGEVFLHYGGLEPGAVRIVLSPVFTHLRRTEPGWLDTRLQRLDALRAQGAVSEEQFASLKSAPAGGPSSKRTGGHRLADARDRQVHILRRLCIRFSGHL